MRKLLYYAIFIAIIMGKNTFVFGQYTIMGQDPAAIKWKKIKTQHFQLVFPGEFDSNAIKIANLLEHVYEPVCKTLNHKPKNISLIIHNRTSVSNGFVTWIPKRMEWFTVPMQNNYPQDWFEQLAIHEFRHAVQMDKFNQGGGKFLYYMFGELGPSSIAGIFVHPWWFEGDAVCAETALSKAGRGRLPDFEMGLRTQVLEKRIYSYDKAVLGSYKNYTANHYELGYLLTAHARQKYGWNVWSNTIYYVAQKPFSFTPFSNAIKYYTGFSKVNLYKTTLKDLKLQWQQQKETTPTIPFKSINLQNTNCYASYHMPIMRADSSIIALRTGLDKTYHFVKIDNTGKEKALCAPGMIQDIDYSANNNTMVWSEIDPDKRWEHKSHSNIWSYKLNTGKKEQITRNSRYFAPAISPNGEKIACIEVTQTNQYFLVILNASNGEPNIKFTVENNDFIMTPSWSEDGKHIVALGLNKDGKYITKFNIESENYEKIKHIGFDDITLPKFYKHYIYFDGNWNGIENIYLLDTLTKNIFQLTSTPYGSKNGYFIPNTNRILYSNYTSNGYKIAYSEFKEELLIPIDKVNDNSIKLYETIAQQEQWTLNPDSILQKNHYIKPYRRGLHLINPHSWLPLYLDMDNSTAAPGISILSQNKLSTMVTSVGYSLPNLDYSYKTSLGFTYYGWYPVISAEGSVGERYKTYTVLDSITRTYYWDEIQLKAGISLPQNDIKGKFYYGYSPSLYCTWNNGSNYTANTPKNQYRGDFISMDYQGYGYNVSRMAHRNIAPKLGQLLELNYRHAPFSEKTKGNIASAELMLYFPGIGQHHSTQIYAGVQQKDITNVIYTNLVKTPRGNDTLDLKNAYISTIDYVLPLFYPDFSIGPLLYTNRIKTGLFYDYVSGTTYKNKNTTYHSTGVDLIAESHFLRTVVPIEWGLRTIYLPETQEIKTEFLFSIQAGAVMPYQKFRRIHKNH